MERNESLAGHIALVTGATGSIGAEVAQALAARGARVAVHGRTRSTLDNLTEQIRDAGGTATAYAGDVRDEAHLGAIAAEIAQMWGPIDILVTLAGGDGAPTPTASLGAERWRSVIETDLTSVFLTVQAVLPGMLEHGQGRIVTVASTAGRRPSRANAAYGAAKAGVIMLTEHIAKEYAPSGVRANCVVPSVVETATLRARVPAPQIEAIAGQVPLGRIGRPSDIADAIVFFATDRSSWVTGTVLDVTGGMSL